LQGGVLRNTRENSAVDVVLPTKKSKWYALPHHEMTAVLWAKVTLGVLFVTFLCPALSYYALFELDLGLCLTLTSLGPIFSLPLAYIMRGESTSARAVLGSILAVAGVAMFFML
jgi:drug/metabolite transporter (DMT)-like permease